MLVQIQTHLSGIMRDVYKRQAVKNGLHSTHIVEFTMDDYITHRGYVYKNTGDIAVSYTHLDVYKRQSKNSSCSIKK